MKLDVQFKLVLVFFVRGCVYIIMIQWNAKIL